MKLGTCILACLAALALPGLARASVWDGAGVFVADPRNLPGPWDLADELQRSGFSWVALRVHDGRARTPVDPMWIDVLRSRGLAVGGWGVERTHPVAEARLADELVQEYALDFYIANAEASYRRDLGRWGRSQTFVSTFRSLEPALPAALVTYGGAPAPWVLPIDFGAWRGGGFDLLPEAYYNQWRRYRPDLTVAHALRAGWSRARVHPVLGVYRRYPAARYLPLLRRAGTLGFSVFLADQARAADYDALANAISAGYALPRG